MATATKTRRKQKQTHTFVSRASNLRLVSDPEAVVRNDRGQVVKNYAGSAVEFQNSRFTVDADDKIMYRGEEVPTVEFLRNHPTFNVDFWELGNAPDEPKPTLAEQNEAIYAAAGKRDVNAIAKIVEEEKRTHNRSQVLQVAEAALIAIAGANEEGAGDSDK